jgi:hypothetical protein
MFALQAATTFTDLANEVSCFPKQGLVMLIWAAAAIPA